jgi:hypothetical protein
VTEHDLSSGELEFSPPDDAVVLTPSDDVSIAYLSAALGTELCKRQILALGLAEPDEGPSPIEIVSSILLPRPDTPEGKDVSRRALASPARQPAPMPVRFVAPPFSEAEAIANAVFVSDCQILPARTVDSASHYLYVEPLNFLQVAVAEGNSPNTMTVIQRGTSPAVLEHEPIAGAALQEVMELFKRSPYHFAWLNLPREVASATGLASAWVLEKGLRVALRKTFADSRIGDEARTICTFLDELLSHETALERLLVEGKAQGSYALDDEYTLELLEKGLLARLREGQFLTPRVFARRAIDGGVASAAPTWSAVRGIDPGFGAHLHPSFRDAASSFVLMDSLQQLLEQYLPKAIGDPSSRGTHPLLIQGQFGAGKSALLAMLNDRARLASWQIRPLCSGAWVPW